MQEQSFGKRMNLYQEEFSKIKKEFSKVVIGQEEVLKKLMIVLLSKGNVLIEGVPGIAKTLIVKTLAKISGCQFSRIQFTPDLLPSDITGVLTYDEVKKFHIIKGPIFANFILADEINRTSPKVQSALLEAMQEKQTTIGKETYMLPDPFFVIATQNPIDSLGVYNLPEAQIDRFLFKLQMNYPKITEEESILNKNITIRNFDTYDIQPVISPGKILTMQKELENIYLDKQLREYIIKIIDATRNPMKYGIESGKYIEFGASPRASIGLYIAAKANALLSNETFVTPHDIKEVAWDVLRHRLLLNYESQTENISSEKIIDEILKKIPIP
jgi:MoxR-like ATPase